MDRVLQAFIFRKRTTEKTDKRGVVPQFLATEKLKTEEKVFLLSVYNLCGLTMGSAVGLMGRGAGARGRQLLCWCYWLKMLLAYR